MHQCLLMIYAPPSVEETLVDWLLEHDAIEGFSSVEASGHGVRQAVMSLLEQVTGRQRRVQFTIKTETAFADHLIQDMRENFAGVGLRYFIVPLMGEGRV